MSAVLTAESGDIVMIAEIVNECKRMGIAILPPDVNQSFGGFTVPVPDVVGTPVAPVDNIIRFGLTTIKNFGEGISQTIITERKANGPFSSFSDFLSRVKDKNLNKKSLESLIKTGALDSFASGNVTYRALLLFNLDRLLEFHKEEQKKESDQDSLFSIMRGATSQANEIHLEPAPKSNPADKLVWEKELLGLYISGHPLDSFKRKLEDKKNDIKKIKETAKEKDSVVLGGIIEEIRAVTTKNGDRMIFLKLADLSDSIEAVAFPKVYEEFRDILIQESCIVVKGAFSTRNSGKSILIDKVKSME